MNPRTRRLRKVRRRRDARLLKLATESYRLLAGRPVYTLKTWSFRVAVSESNLDSARAVKALREILMARDGVK